MSTRQRQRLAFVAALAAACSCVVPNSHAGDQSPPAAVNTVQRVKPSGVMEVMPGNTQEYLNRAQSAVLVICTDRRVQSGRGGNIFTHYRFNLLDTIKGSQPASFEIRLLGGTLGSITVSPMLDSEFQVGSEYVLLLGSNNAEGYPTLNAARVFSVQYSEDVGRKIVVPGLDGITLYERTSGRRLPASTEWAFLDDFVFSMKRAAR